MTGGAVEWVKSTLLEVQGYLGILSKAGRGVVSRPFYYKDVVQQFDAIGIGSLTVVLLPGTFTRLVLALQSGITLDPLGAPAPAGCWRCRRASRSVSSAPARWWAGWSVRRSSRSSARCSPG